MIEHDFDISFIAELALREKQIQQNYRPIIAVHKWFARRPGTLFRGLLLSEFAPAPLRESFYRSHSLDGIRIADPFMGGGTPLLEANRLGCDVLGHDINPMSYWIVKQEIEHLDLDAYRAAAANLVTRLGASVGRYYHTRCAECGSEEAQVKYALWVKTTACGKCHNEIQLFPGYLVSENKRHPKNILLCAGCGNLNEVDDRKRPGSCKVCGKQLTTAGPAKRNKCPCPHCGTVSTYPDAASGPPGHRMFAIEYHCPRCKPHHKGRFFKVPDAADLARFEQAESSWNALEPRYIPEDEIPRGDETDRLHRWGYQFYRQMFNSRQLLGLELSCRFIAEQQEDRVRNALATNLSDLLRYQNMLCRYDSMALKSLDIFSVHGFPVGLIQCESNFLGIPSGMNGDNIGSGGWSNIIAKFTKAKSYCYRPFEILHRGGRKIIQEMTGEWIGETERTDGTGRPRHVELSCSDAAASDPAPQSLDAVLTDPPYYGNVQYAELMDFCYVWLRKLVGLSVPEFLPASTRNPGELTGNENMGRGLEHFSEGLSSVFRKMAASLKPGAPLAFTYHHNRLDAYYPVAVALLDAGLTCSASLPCPAEMGASIHISGTRSSIVDTVFVCRSTGRVPGKWIVDSPEGVADLVRADLEKLRSASGYTVTLGDMRCIVYGHAIRLAIWSLRKQWDKDLPTKLRLRTVADWIRAFGGLESVEAFLADELSSSPDLRHVTAREPQAMFQQAYAQVPF
ncbi:MAG: DNA methylase [Syntrophobacteraceae bacterium]